MLGAYLGPGEIVVNIEVWLYLHEAERVLQEGGWLVNIYKIVVK